MKTVFVEISKQDFINNITDPRRLFYCPKEDIAKLLNVWPDSVTIKIPAHILTKSQLKNLKEYLYGKC